MSIKIGILGYGNLGRGVECAIKQNPDMELVAVFTRRDPSNVSILTESATVCNISDVANWKDKIDVMILCGGSATDLPVQTPEMAKMFNVMIALIHMLKFQSIMLMLMQLPRNQARLVLFQWVGTQECSL